MHDHKPHPTAPAARAQVEEPDALLPAAFRLAGRVAAASPSAVAETLRLLRGRLPWEQLEAAALEEARMQVRGGISTPRRHS